MFSDSNSKIAYKISVEISIYVAKKALGIGKQLLSHSLDEGKRLNLKIIALIFSENKTNLRLF